MVARGSGIAPSPSFSDAWKAQREYVQASESLERDCAAVSQSTAKIAEAASTNQSNSELLQLIEALQQRVTELEKHQRLVSTSQKASYELWKTASLQLIAGGAAGSFSRTGRCLLGSWLTQFLSLSCCPFGSLEVAHADQNWCWSWLQRRCPLWSSTDVRVGRNACDVARQHGKRHEDRSIFRSSVRII